MKLTTSHHVAISRRLQIPLGELHFSFSRSSGPGGQNVNKVNTRVTLTFHVRDSTALTASQKSRLLDGLRTRIDSRGLLRVVSSRHRTQVANRRAVVERFTALLAEALASRKRRIETRVSRAAVARRLRDKAQRSARKRQRRDRPSFDD